MWIDHDNDLVDLTIGWTRHTKHGGMHEDETIHTNQKHPFLTVEAGFVPVSNLNVGMHLVEGNGRIAIIEDWLVIAGSETMYNLTVQQDHTYTVGDGQFVVHNFDCFDTTLKNGENVFITAGRLDHSFDSHGAEWFGRKITNEDEPTWQRMIQNGLQSGQIIEDDLKGRPTWAILSRQPYYDEMRPFMIHIYQDNHDLGTAFRPSVTQIANFFQALGK